MSNKNFIGDRLFAPDRESEIINHKHKGSMDSLWYKYIMSPFCDWVVNNIVSPRLAPNLITLIGMIALLTPVVVGFCLWGFSFHKDEVAPSWFSFLTSAAILTYNFMDNLDGKQARKTGNSSTLGVLFDHGLDSIAASLICISGIYILNLSDYMAYFVVLTANFIFVTKILEEKATGQLVIGLINPVEEGEAFISIVFIIVGIIGNDTWVKPFFGTKLTYGAVCLIFLCFVALIFTLTAFYEIYKSKGIIWYFRMGFQYVFLLSGLILCIVSDLRLVHNQEKYLILIAVALHSRLSIDVILSHITKTDVALILPYPFMFIVVLNTIGILALTTDLNKTGANLERAIMIMTGIIVVFFMIYMVTLFNRLANIIGIRVFCVKDTKLNEKLVEQNEEAARLNSPN